ncbi:MAG: hypothetical protein V1798_02465 [Pseudomonadota bacterium]
MRLKSGEVLEGTIKGVADGVYAVTTREGPERKIAKEQILSIDYTPFPVSKSAKPAGATPNLLTETAKPSSPFATPRLTFEMWKTAAVKGDIDQIVKCYVSSKQKEKAKELKKIPKETFQKMKEVTVETLFSPAEPVYQGDRAMMEVNWTHGLIGESQVLQFVLEKNEWKLWQ